MSLSRVHSRSTDGGAQLTLEDEVLLHKEAQTQLYFDLHQPESKGTLYITSKQLIWLDDQHVDRGYSIDYHHILMHAISRDIQVFSQPSIYCQIETTTDKDQEEEEEEEANDEVENDEMSPSDDHQIADMTSIDICLNRVFELRFVPDDENAVDVIYEKMSQGAAMNPDEIQEGEGEFFFDESSLISAPGFELQQWMASGMTTTTTEESDEQNDEGNGEEEEDGQEYNRDEEHLDKEDIG